MREPLSIQDLLDIMAQKAGEIMQSHFRPGGVVTREKADKTPVTEADIRIGEMVERFVRKHYLNAVLIREEADFPARRGGGLEFVVDEVDGTDGFSRDMPLAVFAAAALFDHHVEHSIIHAPLYFLEPRTHTANRGGGAFLNDELIKVSSRTEKPRIAIATANHPKERYRAWRLAQDLAEHGYCNISTVTSISYSCAMLAAGHLEGVLFPWDTLHDTAPGDLLVREAGGFTSDLNGERLDYSRNSVEGFVMANNEAMQDFLLNAVARHRRTPT